VRRLTAVDLFCGGGGLTEGFKQSGVDVSASLDVWGPAVETHRRNHPETEVFQEDILEFDSSKLPKCDVLIGSPPCTEFSYANRGGHGDLAVGMRFVLRFLRFVHELNPDYWIMENVPRLIQSLPPRVSLRRLGVQEDGFLDIPIRRILNAADYGVPQKRLRLISGRYPLPEQTHSWAEGLGAFANLKPWVPVKSVVGLLPDPLGEPRRGASAHDPCFDLEIPETDLTDHFMDTRLDQSEIEVNRKSKTDHSWYGRMSFPDPIDRPARTVMATQTGISRETLVLEWKHDGHSFYRRPTIRECASFQSFPITYQFWGATAQTRYKLVGNAVPPLLAASLARSLLVKEGLTPPTIPALSRTVGERPDPVTLEPTSGRRQGHNYPEGRKFRDHVPGSKSHGVRVDLANVISNVLEDDEESIDVRWEARLITGSGKRVLVATPAIVDSIALLLQWGSLNGEVQRVDQFLARLDREISSKPFDSESLQAAWAGRIPNPRTTPATLLRVIAEFVNAFFPSESFEDVVVELPSSFARVSRAQLPLRALAQLVGVELVVDAAITAPRRDRLEQLVKQSFQADPSSKTRRPTVLVDPSS
jgi:DNA (cytosine-5)-methyltransferase 1